MTPVERLQTALTSLGLKAVEARLESLLEQAAKKEPSYGDFLDEVLACEVEARRTRYLRARLQLAHLPFVKTFEQFDFGFQPSIDERQIRELRTLRFVHEASNVILPPLPAAPAESGHRSDAPYAAAFAGPAGPLPVCCPPGPCHCTCNCAT
jgi:DNA replication protein DnaC